MSPARFFPSIYMQAEKIIELLIWWLNPLEKPPQKILSISEKGKKHNFFIDLLKQAEYEGHNLVIENFTFMETIKDTKFNLVFIFELNLANLINKKEIIIDFFSTIHEKILKSSSYLILEIKFGSESDIDILEKLLLESGFGSITVLIPELKSDLKNNPFASVDFSIHNYCWMTALSKQSDDPIDVIDWLNEYIE